MSVYPWNLAVWQRLARERERLPHALLLHGMPGVGKYALARALAQWLLCRSPTPQGGCGRCQACAWFAQDAHPDLHRIEPQADSDEAEKGKRGGAVIKIGQLREVIEALSLSAHQGGWRVAIIRPAEAMNAAAANALLKTLEEPPPGVLLILVSHRPRRLLPTVRSRCRAVAIPRPTWQLALDWLTAQGVHEAEAALREAGGAPLLALDYADPEHCARRECLLQALAEPSKQDWCALAKALQGTVAETWGWLTRWVSDLIACKSGAPIRYFPQHTPRLQSLAARANPVRLWALYQTLLMAGRYLQHPLNPQLLLESWLLRYARMEDRA
ncbi:MAG: DNA polymerase III subunit delta' [Thiobacillaceae bacterium]